jgi:hypothetical protein
MNIDIGTIVIYTCKNSCVNQNNFFIEEYAFIQRSGEKIIETRGKFSKNKNNKQDDNSNTGNTNLNQSETSLYKDMNKLTIKGNSNNEPDEDGFIEVKKKRKK